MKTLLIIIILAAAGLGVAVYLNPGLLDMVRDHTVDRSSTVYKWQDKNGTWHVTSAPPPAGTPYTQQQYLNDTNVLPPPQEKK